MKLISSIKSCATVFVAIVMSTLICKTLGQKRDQRTLQRAKSTKSSIRINRSLPVNLQAAIDPQEALLKVEGAAGNDLLRRDDSAVNSIPANTDGKKSQVVELFNRAKKHEKNEHLTAIVHVGPMKTGSSAIQQALHRMKEDLLLDQFEAGNEYFRGPAHKFFMCFDDASLSSQDEVNIPCVPNVLKEIQDISLERHHNLIISSEGFHRPETDLPMLKEYLISSGWNNVIIVMYYRRYYEWVLSFHNQGSKHQDISKRITIVQSIANRKKTARTAEQTQNGDKWGNQYVVDEYHRYDKQFENIKIYNIHNIRNGDVREPIICEVLSNRNQSNVTTSNNASGSHSCNRLRTIQRAEEDISKANSHEPLIYSELAYFALQMSLWKERGDLTINDVTALIADRQERILNMTEHDFTTGVTCISEESYDWLLQSSLEAEEILFPEFYRIQGKDEVIEGFNKSKRSFCHVDARAVLSDETDSNSIGWRDFFKSL